MNLDALKFPIGKFKTVDFTQEVINASIEDLKQFPTDFEALVNAVKPHQLDWLYRPEGWSIRQVIHHLPDSHANGYMRFKFALSEDHPTIKPYNEANWANLPDTANAPVQSAIDFCKGVHSRWVALLESMSKEDYERTLFHPEYNRTFALKSYLPLYAWHGKHHLAHIKQALAHENQF
ncbi:MAG: putative metal-dependent hydrolase [Bacteroidetes bacterium]|nr:putative metal-dependent hydrolase [Bacteroidota bacterium]